MLKKSDDIAVGDEIKGFRGVGKVVFIRWYEGNFQNRGYFIVEFGNELEPEIVTVYKNEQIEVLD